MTTSPSRATVDTPTPTAVRASWSGRLELGPLQLPVKAYPAVVVPSGGPLHQIHLACGARIAQRKVCPTHGELAAAEIGKAYEYGPNDQVPLTTDELKSLAADDDSTIRIEHLTPTARFDSTLLSGRSLYLVPAHPAAEPDYARALAVLGGSGVWAVGRTVLSDQRRAVALRIERKRLVLYVLHWPEHRRACPGAEIDAAAVTGGELRALEKALLPLHRSFAWEEYHDEAAERLQALISEKIAVRHRAPTAAPKRGKRTADGAAPPRSRRAA